MLPQSWFEHFYPNEHVVCPCGAGSRKGHGMILPQSWFEHFYPNEHVGRSVKIMKTARRERRDNAFPVEEGSLDQAHSHPVRNAHRMLRSNIAKLRNWT